METRPVFSLHIPALKMVGIGIVYLLGVLMEYLKLDEVDSLLKEIDIPKVLQMENEFRLGS